MTKESKGGRSHSGYLLRVRTILGQLFSNCSIVVVLLFSAGPVHADFDYAELNSAEELKRDQLCQRILNHFPANSFGVNWFPYASKPVEVPDVLSDPIILHVLKAERFRVSLREQIRMGDDRIVDYKQLADARPRYAKGEGPKLGDLYHGKIGNDPSDLPVSQILDYIHTNYELPGDEPNNRAFFKPHEKVERHPFFQAWSAKGLIESDKSLPMIGEALQHLHVTWEDLLRQAPPATIRDSHLDTGEFRYFASGGRFREGYLWDAYWSIQGAVQSGYGNLALEMLEIPIRLFNKYGIDPNGYRFYYLTRTQPPVQLVIAKYLSEQGFLNFEDARSDSSKLEARYLDFTANLYKTIWKGGERYLDKWGLFTYSDGTGGSGFPEKIVIRPESSVLEPRTNERHSTRVFAETGWDMSYSRFGEHPENFIPVDLTFLLMDYAKTLGNFMMRAGRFEESQYFFGEYNRIRERAEEVHLNPDTGLYMDTNHVTGKRSEVVTAASFFPFFFEHYPNNSASRKIFKQLLSMLKPRGVMGVQATDRPGKGQWDEWIWGNLNDIAFKSAVKYDLLKEADEIAFDFSLMAITTFHKEGGVFFEKCWKDGSIELPDETEIYGNEEGFVLTNGPLTNFLKWLAGRGKLHQLEAEIAQRLHK